MLEGKLSFGALHRFAASVPKVLTTNQALIQSTEFLTVNIPPRAAKRSLALLDLPKSWPSITQLAKRYEDLANCPFAHVVDGKRKPIDTGAALAFSTWYESKMLVLEHEIAEYQLLLRDMMDQRVLTPGQQEVESFLTATYNNLIVSTLLLNQHKNYVRLAGKAPEEITDDNYHSLPVVTRYCNLLDLAADVADDCRSECIKAHGDAPDVVVSAGRGFEVDQPGSTGAPKLLVVKGHVYFILREVILRAMDSTALALGRRIQTSPPIQITLSKSESEIGIRVSDRSGGIPPQLRGLEFCFLFDPLPHAEHNSAHAERGVHPTKPSGSRWAGPGLGLPLARLHCRLAGGDLVLQNLPGHGTDAFITLSRFGTAALSED